MSAAPLGAADGWIAAGTWATVLVLAATLVYAVKAVGEARELRRDEFRPWVTVSFHFRSIFAFIAIENIGRTVAHDVRLTFDPEIVSAVRSADELAGIALLREPIPTLVPGERRLVYFDDTRERYKDASLPLRHSVFVSYTDQARNSLPTDEFLLDFGSVFGTSVLDKGIHDLAEAVIKIEKKLR